MVTDDCVNSNSGSGNIRIEVNTKPAGSLGVTCAKEITATIYGTTFTLREGMKKAIVSNNALEKEGEYKVYNYAGSYIHITTIHGISLLFDNSTRLYITAEPRYFDKLCGLCGNFNDNEDDDFITYQGVTTASALEFGDSWATSDTCLDAVEVENLCDSRPLRLQAAKKECALIEQEDGPFHACHNLVPKGPYYDMCVFDACGCDELNDCKCICNAIAAYQAECQNEGVFIEWRTGHHICGNSFIHFAILTIDHIS